MYEGGRNKSKQSEVKIPIYVLGIIISVLVIGTEVCAEDVKKRYRMTCPETETIRNESALIFGNCTSDKSYHCLQTIDGKFIEQCMVPFFVETGLCPIAEHVDKLGNIWHFVNCTSVEIGCPDEGYASDEVYKYQGCYERNAMNYSDISTESSQGRKDETKTREESPIVPFQQTVTVIAAISFILISIITTYCFIQKRRHSTKRKQEKQTVDNIGSQPVQESPIYFDIDEQAIERPVIFYPSPIRDSFDEEGEYAVSNFNQAAKCDSDSCYDFAMFR